MDAITTAIPTLYAATGDALARVSDGRVELLLEGGGARCLAVAPDGSVFAGGPRGVFASDGALLFDGDVFSVAAGPDGALYAGCEPSSLHRSDDGGATWRELTTLLDLPSRPTWSFPPRPWTSHVRWIAPSPHDAQLLLVGIELGGLMRSTDGGETWADHRPGAQPDVHTLAWHPEDARRAFEAGGGGAAWSADGGDTWTPADEGRDRNYCWAVAAHEDTWWVSASTGPFAAHGRGDPQAKLFRRDGDEQWREVRAFDSMPYALAVADGRLLVGLRDGRILDGDDVVARVPAVHALAVA